jgi:hypothetical protein
MDGVSERVQATDIALRAAAVPGPGRPPILHPEGDRLGAARHRRGRPELVAADLVPRVWLASGVMLRDVRKVVDLP